MSDMPLLDWVPPTPFVAHGSTFDQDRDGARLQGQCLRVYQCMADGKPRTLRQIEIETGDPQASVSARLRQLRTDFGFIVEREYVGGGIWCYVVRKP